MRRDANDIQWQECKREVRRRDENTCLLCSCFTPEELAIRREENYCFGSFSLIDPAHYHAASTHQDEIYNPDNVFCLCRSCHESLDHMYSPLTGKHIDAEQVRRYWDRIRAKREQNLAHNDGPDLLGMFDLNLD